MQDVASEGDAEHLGASQRRAPGLRRTAVAGRVLAFPRWSGSITAVSDEPTWMQVLLQMVHGPERTLQGVTTSRDSADQRGNSASWAVVGQENVPVLTGNPHLELHRVWRDGDHLRVARADGSPVLIADDEHGWGFDDEHPAPRVVRSRQVWGHAAGTHLLVRREAQQWLDDDFTRPTGRCGRTMFLGRAAWTVELAPPAHKPHPAQLVVDAETGVVLQQRVDAVGAVDEWTEITVGASLDPALFTWSGPVRTHDDEHERTVADQNTERDGHCTWFADHVVPVGLSVDVTLDLTVQRIHTHDDHTGAFEADLGGSVASLARRPHASTPWERHWHGEQHTWVAGGFDWAVMVHEHPLAPHQLISLQHQLGAPPSSSATHGRWGHRGRSCEPRWTASCKAGYQLLPSPGQEHRRASITLLDHVEEPGGLGHGVGLVQSVGKLGQRRGDLLGAGVVPVHRREVSGAVHRRTATIRC